MPTTLRALASRAKRGHERTKQGRAGWLAGTFELAAALSEARKKLPANSAFSEWLVRSKLTMISNDDRAALITIGQNVEAARKQFKANDDAWSWRHCADGIKASSQPAKTVYQMVRVLESRHTIRHPVYASAPEPPKPAHLKLVSSSDGKPEQHVEEYDEPELLEPEQDEPAEPFDTTPLHEAIAAVEGVIAASSLSTGTVALLWSGAVDQPTPDQVREAAAWLETLADAMEQDQRPERQSHRH